MEVETILCLFCHEQHPADKIKFLAELKKHFNYKTYCCAECTFAGVTLNEVMMHYESEHPESDINIRRTTDVYFENLITRIYQESVAFSKKENTAAEPELVVKNKIKMLKHEPIELVLHDTNDTPKQSKPPAESLMLKPVMPPFGAANGNIPMPFGYNYFYPPNQMPARFAQKKKGLMKQDSNLNSLDELFGNYQIYFPYSMGIADKKKSIVKPLIQQCHHFESFCSRDVNCSYAHGTQITYGVAGALIGHTLKHFKQQNDLDQNKIKRVAARLRIANKEENNFDIGNKEKSEEKIRMGISNSKNSDKEAIILNFLRKSGLACMQCSTPVFDMELDSRKSHVLSFHSTDPSASDLNIIQTLLDCFPDSHVQLLKDEKSRKLISQIKEQKHLNEMKEKQKHREESLARQKLQDKFEDRIHGRETRLPSSRSNQRPTRWANDSGRRSRSRSQIHRERENQIEYKRRSSPARREPKRGAPSPERSLKNSNQRPTRWANDSGRRSRSRSQIRRERENQSHQSKSPRRLSPIRNRNSEPAYYERSRAKRQSSPEACRFFDKNGWCGREACPYMHVASTKIADKDYRF